MGPGVLFATRGVCNTRPRKLEVSYFRFRISRFIFPVPLRILSSLRQVGGTLVHCVVALREKVTPDNQEPVRIFGPYSNLQSLQISSSSREIYFQHSARLIISSQSIAFERNWRMELHAITQKTLLAITPDTTDY